MNDFAVALKQEAKYRTYILSDRRAHSRLEIVPERGGLVTSWRIQGQNLLYLDSDRLENPELTVQGGIPLLFPICGELQENKYQHNDQIFNLRRHGFARDLPWSVISQDCEDSASLELSLKSSAETLRNYPFEFQLDVTYELAGNQLRIQQRCTNQGDEAMPFCLGFHPYFWTPQKPKLRFDIPANRVRDRLQGTPSTSPQDADFDYQAPELLLEFGELTAQQAVLYDDARRYRLEIAFSELYTRLVFWTLRDKDYVCLVPWSAPADALNSGESVRYLEPDATCEATVTFQVFYF